MYRIMRRVAVLAAVCVVGVSAAVLLSGVGSSRFQTAYTDLVQLFVAAAASATAAVEACRRSGRSRWSWLLLSAASASWAAGEAVWTWYELRLGDQSPFPSLADVGFLGFPVAAGMAMLLWPATGTPEDRKRRVLDATIATAATALISWQTVLSAVLDAGGTALELVVSLAYPLSDVLLLVLVVLTLGRVRSRATLLLAAAGMASLALGDSAFAYVSATGAYAAGALDLGWIGGFALLALAPLFEHADDNDAGAGRGDGAVRGASVYPYVAVALAGAVTLGRAVAGRPPTTGQLALATVIVLLLLLRQYLTLRENVLLTRELAAREAELRHLAFHDPLTGLANRALFHDRLAHALDLHARDLRPISLIFLDLDEFKIVNDGLGHAAGDELLIRVAERLTTAVRKGDTVARLGGDEFAVLLEDGGDAATVGHGIGEAIRLPFTVQGQRVTVGASLGVVQLPSEAAATTADALLTHADTAMYAAKRSGKDRLEVYVPGMALHETQEQALAAAFSDALAQGDLRLVFQPIFDLRTRVVVAVEALTRWDHQCVAVSPAVFVPLAERTGAIAPFTAWVLDQACAQMARWNAAGGAADLRVCVNVSACQISDAAFPAVVWSALDRHRVRPTQLTLEITETAIISDTEQAAAVTGALRARGVHIALDDFGVGQAALSQLHAVELDVLKIDQSFVDQIDTSPRQASLLRTLLRVGHDLDLQVIIEGVERPAQLRVLQQLGVQLAQGYLLARPEAGSSALTSWTMPQPRGEAAVGS